MFYYSDRITSKYTKCVFTVTIETDSCFALEVSVMFPYFYVLSVEKLTMK